MIAAAVRNKKFTVYEEVHGISQDGSTQYIDMIAIDSATPPGIWNETHTGHPNEIHAKKITIYAPIIPYYKQKYNL